MTRKDYVLIAAAIARVPVRGPVSGEVCKIRKEAREICAFEIASTLAADNARFDRARFMAACGVQL